MFVFFPPLGFSSPGSVAWHEGALRNLSPASSDTAVTGLGKRATGQDRHAWVTRSNKELVFRQSSEAGSD